jgi:hypothetical protein
MELEQYKEAQNEGIKGKKENQHIIISRKSQKKGIGK